MSTRPLRSSSTDGRSWEWPTFPMTTLRGWCSLKSTTRGSKSRRRKDAKGATDASATGNRAASRCLVSLLSGSYVPENTAASVAERLPHHVRGYHDQELIMNAVSGIAAQETFHPGELAQQWQAPCRTELLFADQAHNHGRLSILHRDCS